MLAKLMRKRFGKTEQLFLIFGLGGAGKRTVLKGIWGKFTTSQAATSLTVSTFEHKRSRWVAGDIADDDRIRPLWREYYADITGLIFVVDAGDHARIEAAWRNLHRVISDRYMTDAPLLVIANKQDLVNALAPIAIKERLALDQIRDRAWFVQPACATRIDGLYEGVTWLAAALG